MFDVSYQTMLELVGSMREFVKENPVESNLREMGRACIETYAIRPLEDRDDHSLYLEALYWYQRLYDAYPKEEYAKIVQRLEKDLPESLKGFGIYEMISAVLEHLEAKERPDGDLEAKEQPDGS